MWDAYETASRALAAPTPKSAMASAARHHARLKTQRVLELLAEADRMLMAQRKVGHAHKHARMCIVVVTAVAVSQRMLQQLALRQLLRTTALFGWQCANGGGARVRRRYSRRSPA